MHALISNRTFFNFFRFYFYSSHLLIFSKKKKINKHPPLSLSNPLLSSTLTTKIFVLADIIRFINIDSIDPLFSFLSQNNNSPFLCKIGFAHVFFGRKFNRNLIINLVTIGRFKYKFLPERQLSTYYFGNPRTSRLPRFFLGTRDSNWKKIFEACTHGWNDWKRKQGRDTRDRGGGLGDNQAEEVFDRTGGWANCLEKTMDK